MLGLNFGKIIMYFWPTPVNEWGDKAMYFEQHDARYHLIVALHIAMQALAIPLALIRLVEPQVLQEL